MLFPRALQLITFALIFSACQSASPPAALKPPAHPATDDQTTRLLAELLATGNFPPSFAEQVQDADDRLFQDLVRQAVLSEKLSDRSAAILAADSAPMANLRLTLAAIQQAMTVSIENLRNTHVDGYKRMGTSFTQGATHPVLARDFSQGPVRATGRVLDMSIQGKGFFQLRVSPEGSARLKYTRVGQFYLDANGELRINNAEGYKLDPPLRFPANTTTITIGQDGRTSFNIAGAVTPLDGPSIRLYRFPSAGDLASDDGLFFTVTEQSGTPIAVAPGEGDSGTLQQGCIESSNVDPTVELVEILKLRRWYSSITLAMVAANSQAAAADAAKH